MLWELGLIATIALGAAIALDARGDSHRSVLNPVALLGLAASVWATGELLSLHATTPQQLLWCRRLLFAGACSIGPLLLCAALELSPLRIRRTATPFLLLAALIESVSYATLFTSRSELFTSGRAGAHAYGPVFFAHAVVAWATLATAISLLTLAAWRARGIGRVAAVAALVGASTPVVFNGIYVALHWPAHDPTPIAAGLGAIALRWGVVELLGAQFLTARARSDLLDQIEAAILVADAQGRILEANRMARQLFDGRTPVGVDLREALVRFGGDPGFSVREFPLLRRGARVGLGAVITDRREERAAERRIDVENRLEALGILAGGLAHEINNPLAVVSGNAELLAMRLRNRLPDALGVEIARLLGDIDAGAARIAEIVRRMLRLSAPADDAPGAEAVDVALVAERAAALARIGKGAASVEVRGGSAHARASVRTGELLELLFHLIQNAVQASGGGTPVEVQIDSAEASVQIRVLDRGPGLPNGDAARVFEPFFTTDQPRRTGLGLSLCWELARQNGGTLEAFARDGGGTEFRLVLPRA